MGHDDAARCQRSEDQLPGFAHGSRSPYFQVATEQPPRFARDGPLDVRGEQAHADQRAHAERNADKTIEKVPPGGARLAPGHVQREAGHDSPPAPPSGSRTKRSVSTRPSRRLTMRSIED